MRNIGKRKYLTAVSAAAIGIAAFAIIFMYSPISNAIDYEPGSKEDPLVTQNYVEKRFEQFKQYIDQRLDGLKTGDNGSSPVIENSVPTFEVIQMERNQRLVCGEGTEVILRSGEALAVASESGGLSDVTQGKDLKMGESISLNHLLIIPRDDGRGIKARTSVYVMVKGNYRIQ